MKFDILKKPAPFQMGTMTTWSNEYIAMNVLRKHLNQYENSGSRTMKFIEASCQWIAEKFPAAKDIVDIGCGPGLYAPILCEYGYNYVGLDISKYHIFYANKHCSIPEKTRFDVCDIREWSSKPKFDVALLLYGIYSFYKSEERIRFLKNIFCSLHNNGCAIIEVFTEQHYVGRKDSYDWQYICKQGFWSEFPHIELNSFVRYKEENLILVQAATISNVVDVWNSWIQLFDWESLKMELMEAGFTRFEIYGSCCGEPFEENSDVLCVCAY